jgi:TonB-linked SusC/RagA family outer membrane protein
MEAKRILYSKPGYLILINQLLNRSVIAGLLLTVPVFAQATVAAPINHPLINTKLAQDIQISGKVVDEKGLPLPGVSVLIKGTTQGTSTDGSGKYSLRIPSTSTTLVFSYTGYNKQEVLVGDRKTVNVQLAVSSQSLNDVVVVGYGTQKKATLTGSISEVKGAELTKSPAPNLSNSFAGRVSGLIVSNPGGEPGYDGSTISVRGLATTGNNDVLVVVDGIPGQVGGLERLDPNDIESVTVLKDASAAIYGNRAANGVILVTTKRGKLGKPTISYSFNQGFSSPTRLPEMADAGTYAEIMNEINASSPPYTAEQIQKFRNGSDPLNYPNTNWEKEVLKSTALQSQHNLSVSGGSEDTKYFLSLGMIDQDGLYKNGVTNYSQYNFRSNVDANITKRFKVSLSLSGRQEDRLYPASGAGDIFRSIYRAKPIVGAYYPNGLPTTGIENSNPALQVTDIGGVTKNPRQVFNGILKANYTIPGIDGLSVDGFYSVDKLNALSKAFYTPYNVYRYEPTTDSYSKIITGGTAGAPSLNESSQNRSMITSNVKLNYTKQFGLHNVNAFVGYEQSETHEENFSATRINFPSAQTPELSQGGAAAADKRNDGNSFNFTRQSIISRLAYNYAEKYLLEGQLRADGSSTFAPGHQWGYFPSISAGYRISKESWFENKVVNDLKFRASYGTLGNDNVLPYQFYENYALNNRYVLSGSNGIAINPGIDLIKLANPNITWEVAKKLDIGLNAVFLKNFSLEVIYFQQHRTEILANRNASLPGTSGIVNPFGSDPLVPSENIGKVNNQGFEGTLGYNHPGEFSWGASVNGTFAKNKIIFMDEAPGLLAYQRETGGPLRTSLLYNSIGMFRTQADLDNYPHVTGAALGDLIYEDYNKDGKIDANDQVRTPYGNIPQITFGLNLYANYKNFDISVLLAGQARVTQYVLPEAGSVGNFYSSWADNRWSPTNPNGSYPRVSERSSSAISGGLYNNTFWLNDASFLRLKNVQVGYNLPTSMLSKIKLAGVRVYASGFNLFTLSKVKDYDPEGTSGSGQFYPQQKIMNLGVNVKF